MDKHTQLIKFGTVIKQRRIALNLSLRELEKQSCVSAALITKLENGKMANFPKAITIKQLNIPDKTFEDELRELLATKTTLNSENITHVIYFISGLEKLQKIQNL